MSEFPQNFPTEEELEAANKWWHDLYLFLCELRKKYQKKDVPQR
jgi:hypothetical protein